MAAPYHSRWRRFAFRRALAALLLSMTTVTLNGCSDRGKADWHNNDVSGAMPDLAFTLTRASDGRQVSARDYAGHPVLIYFGYSYCPDVCPLTLQNLALALKKAGPAADAMRILFVTVDPERDTPDVLKHYAAAFGPHVEGLRGDGNALAALAKRYRIAYSVTPDADPAKYEVTHSSAIYAFDGSGKAKLLITSMSNAQPDIDGTADDLRQLAAL